MTAVIYTHAHVDHFGGVRGVHHDGIPIVAAHGFMEAAVAENVYAGGAMNRRAEYMYGAKLPKGARGQIGAGLGQTNSLGAVGVIHRRSRSPRRARRKRSTVCRSDSR